MSWRESIEKARRALTDAGEDQDLLGEASAPSLMPAEGVVEARAAPEAPPTRAVLSMPREQQARAAMPSLQTREPRRYQPLPQETALPLSEAEFARRASGLGRAPMRNPLEVAAQELGRAAVDLTETLGRGAAGLGRETEDVGRGFLNAAAETGTTVQQVVSEDADRERARARAGFGKPLDYKGEGVGAFAGTMAGYAVPYGYGAKLAGMASKFLGLGPEVAGFVTSAGGGATAGGAATGEPAGAAAGAAAAAILHGVFLRGAQAIEKYHDFRALKAYGQQPDRIVEAAQLSPQDVLDAAAKAGYPNRTVSETAANSFAEEPLFAVRRANDTVEVMRGSHPELARLLKQVPAPVAGESLAHKFGRRLRELATGEVGEWRPGQMGKPIAALRARLAEVDRASALLRPDDPHRAVLNAEAAELARLATVAERVAEGQNTPFKLALGQAQPVTTEREFYRASKDAASQIQRAEGLLNWGVSQGILEQKPDGTVGIAESKGTEPLAKAVQPPVQAAPVPPAAPPGAEVASQAAEPPPAPPSRAEAPLSPTTPTPSPVVAPPSEVPPPPAPVPPDAATAAPGAPVAKPVAAPAPAPASAPPAGPVEVTPEEAAGMLPPEKPPIAPPPVEPPVAAGTPPVPPPPAPPVASLPEPEPGGQPPTAPPPAPPPTGALPDDAADLLGLLAPADKGLVAEGAEQALAASIIGPNMVPGAPPPVGPKPKMVREGAALRATMRAAQRASSVAFKAGSKEKQELVADLTERATRLLEPLNRPKLLASVMKQIAAANTPGEVQDVMERIVRHAVEDNPSVIMTEEQFHGYMNVVANRSLRSGYAAGVLDLSANQQEIMDFALKNLPAAEYKAIAKTLERILTQRVLQPAVRQRIINTINRVVAGHEHQSLVSQAKEALAKAKKADLRPAERKALDDLMEGFALKRPSPDMARRLEAVINARQQELQTEETPVEPPSALVQRAREILVSVHQPLLRDLDNDDLRTIGRAAVELVHTSIMKDKLIAAHKLGTATRARERSVADMAHKHGNKFKLPPGAGVGVQPKPSMLGRYTYTIARSHETLVDRLGGEGTVTKELLVENPRRGMAAAYGMRDEGFAARDAALTAAGVDPKNLETWRNEAVEVPVGGSIVFGVGRPKTITMTRGQLGELVNLLKRAKVRDDVLRNKNMGVHIEGTRKPLKLDATSIRAILNSPAAKEVAAVGDALREHLIKSIGPQVSARHRGDFGWDLKTEEDYWPSRRKMEAKEVEPEVFLRTFREKHLADLGFLKPKQRSALPYAVGDMFETFDKAVTDAGRYVHMGPAINDARRLLGNPEWREAVKDNIGRSAEVLRDLEGAIRSFEGMDITPKGDVDRLANWMVRNIHRYGLGFKPWIWLYQPISYATALAEVPAPILARTLAKVALHPGLIGEARRFLEAEAPIMNARFNSTTHERMTPGAMKAPSRLGKAIDWAALSQISYMDTQTISTLLLAVMDEAGVTFEQLSVSPELIKKVVERHDYVVRRTQPVWDALSINPLQREGLRSPIKKLAFTTFSAQPFQNVNVAMRAFDREFGTPPDPDSVLADSPGKPRAKSKAKFIADILTPLVVTAAAVHYTRKWTRGAIDSIVQRMGRAIGLLSAEPRVAPKEAAAWGVFQRVIGQWPIFGRLGASVISATAEARGDRGASRVGGMAVVDVGVAIGQAAGDVYTAIENAVTGATFKAGEQKGEKKWKTSLTRALESLVTPVSMLTGLPLEGPKMMGRSLLHPLPTKTSVAGTLLWTLTGPAPKRKLSESEEKFAARVAEHEAEVKKATTGLRELGMKPGDLRAAFKAAGVRRLAETPVMPEAEKAAAPSWRDAIGKARVKESGQVLEPGDPQSWEYARRKVRLDEVLRSVGGR